MKNNNLLDTLTNAAIEAAIQESYKQGFKAGVLTGVLMTSAVMAKNTKEEQPVVLDSKIEAFLKSLGTNSDARTL